LRHKKPRWKGVFCNRKAQIFSGRHFGMGSRSDAREPGERGGKTQKWAIQEHWKRKNSGSGRSVRKENKKKTEEKEHQKKSSPDKKRKQKKASGEGKSPPARGVWTAVQRTQRRGDPKKPKMFLRGGWKAKRENGPQIQKKG